VTSFIEFLHCVKRYHVKLTDGQQTDGQPENNMPPPPIGGGINITAESKLNVMQWPLQANA